MNGHQQPNNPDLSLLNSIFNRYSGIEAVYLFGSIASGSGHVDSDLDLAIVPGNKSLRRYKLDILTDLASWGFWNIDLIFLDGRDVVLEYEAVRQNVLLYERSGFDRGAYYSRTIRRYLDFCPFLKVQRMAYKERIFEHVKK